MKAELQFQSFPSRWTKIELEVKVEMDMTIEDRAEEKKILKSKK